MGKNDTNEMTRREFLAWLAAAAAVAALPSAGGLGGLVHAAPPSWAFADLDLPFIDLPPADAGLVIPDPPPPIVNPPGVNTPASPRLSLSARAPYGRAPQPQVQATAYEPPAPAAPVYQAPAAPVYQAPAAPVYQAPAATYQAPAPVSYQSTAAYSQPIDYGVDYAVERVQPSPARRGFVAPSPAPIAAPGEKVRALSRRLWADMPANPAKMRPMGQVRRITIHHEGSEKPNNDTMPFDVVATLRIIHGQHRKRMGAGDIGYHFIIDRTGMIWQGRNWNFQGAHTSGANTNNLGVMLLGNFEVQRPTQAQINSLHRLTASLIRRFGLNPSTDIFGHGDLSRTQCPGVNLRPQVDILRRMAL